MLSIDIFNGDADGIAALRQWRLAYPSNSTLITGVKRDNQLLKKVPLKEGQQLTVFDISLKPNLPFLKPFLEQQNTIIWLDHHQAGSPPQHPNLELHIDPSPETCTSHIVNQLLGEKYPKWAAMGAFGDNLHDLGKGLSKSAGCSELETQKIEELGKLINYNAYGESIEDLHFSPTEVYQEIINTMDPLDFYSSSTLFKQLKQGFETDFSKIENVQIEDFQSKGAIAYLPNEKWARRVIGTYANQLSSENLNRPHAILLKKEGGWLVSVRAPGKNPIGADTLCSQFGTGGGRSKAAGINLLPDDQLSVFIEKLRNHF